MPGTPGSEAWYERQSDMLFEALESIRREQMNTTVQLEGVRSQVATLSEKVTIQNGRVGKLEAGEQARVVAEAVKQAVAQGVETGRDQVRNETAVIITRKQMLTIGSGMVAGLTAVATIVRYAIGAAF